MLTTSSSAPGSAASCVLANRLSENGASPGAAARKPAATAAVDPDADRLRRVLLRSRRQLDVPDRAGGRRSADGRAIGRPARSWAGRARSTPWSYPRPGRRFPRLARRGTRLGLERRPALSREIGGFSRGGDGWRGTGGPLAVSRMSAAIAIRFATRILRACDEIGLPRARRISTGRRQRRCGPLPDHDARRLRACRRRAPICGRRKRRQPARRDAGAGRRASLSTARARWASTHGQHGTRAECARRRARSSCPPARSTRRSCCNSPVSGPALALRSAASTSCTTRPGGRPQSAGPSLHRPSLPLARADAAIRSSARGGAGSARRLATMSARRRGPLSISVNQGGGFIRTRPASEAARTSSSISRRLATPARCAGQAARLMRPDAFPGFLLERPAVPADQPRASRACSRRSVRGARDLPEFLVDERRHLASMLEGAKFLRRLAAAPSLGRRSSRRAAAGRAVQIGCGVHRRHQRARVERVPPGQHLPHGTGRAARMS